MNQGEDGSKQSHKYTLYIPEYEGARKVLYHLGVLAKLELEFLLGVANQRSATKIHKDVFQRSLNWNASLSSHRPHRSLLQTQLLHLLSLLVQT